MTEDQADRAVLKQRLDHLEPRVEHVHVKNHETANKVIGIDLKVMDLRHSVDEGCRVMERIQSNLSSATETVNRVAAKQEIDRERFETMQGTMKAVLSSIRAVAIGSATVVIGAMLIEVYQKVKQ